MTVKHVKQALLTGVGEAYLQFMDTEESTTQAPGYNETVYVTPSIDKVAVALELATKKVYASNMLHSNPEAVKSANITLDALYLPNGFAEEAQGMKKIGGGWSMPVNPKKKYFRFTFPLTNDKGEALVVTFPKCSLSPVDFNGETEREDINEQVQQFNILATPLVFKVDGEQYVYHKVDLSMEENATKYDLAKLLEKGWYSKETADECAKVPGG